MGRKVFVSYKYKDNDVKKIPDVTQPTWPCDYVDYMDYDKAMRRVPYGKLLTVGAIREYFAEKSGADFTEPITAGIFVSIAAWASDQRSGDKTPYWRTLKANGELNAKYPGGVEAQKEKLEAEGHTIIQKGRKNIRYYVKDYENALFSL